MPLQIGKIPIVVPRQKQFDEHVNDHQVDFCRAVSRRQGNIILAEEMETLKEAILHYDTIAAGMSAGQASNNARFNEAFAGLAAELLGQK